MSSEASAVSSLTKALKKGLIPGVRKGWKQRLYPSDAAVAVEEKSP